MNYSIFSYLNNVLETNTYKYFRKYVYRYPIPVNISYLWNFGSLAGLCLVIQVITGVCLAMSYTPHVDFAFSSIEHIMRDVQYGWLLRYTHFNGASMFFLVVYLHMFRGIYYGSYAYPRRMVWIIGWVIWFLMIATAFMGYVLPWGQMSFWAATVITSLFSAIPVVGGDLVQWLWGGYSVDNPTLNRFFSLHYLLPFVIIALAGLHIAFLNLGHSSNPLGVKSYYDYVPFHPYFTIKDLVGVFVFFIVFSLVIFFFPNSLGHPDNYIYADSLVTPTHIVPEWYYLPVYAVLRCVPDKLGGVAALAAFLIALLVLGFSSTNLVRSVGFRKRKFIYWFFVFILLILGYLGAAALSYPFTLFSVIFTVLYFIMVTILFDSFDNLTVHSI